MPRDLFLQVLVMLCLLLCQAFTSYLVNIRYQNLSTSLYLQKREDVYADLDEIIFDVLQRM